MADEKVKVPEAADAVPAKKTAPAKKAVAAESEQAAPAKKTAPAKKAVAAESEQAAPEKKPAVKKKADAEVSPAAVETPVAAKEKVAKRATADTNVPKVKITLVKSTIACSVKQKRTVEALGLKKIRSQKVHNDSPALRGMIFVVKHMVKVEPVK